MHDMPTPHTILVTGSAGIIGRRVCAALAERGHTVRGFDRQRNRDLADHVVGDIAKPKAVFKAMRGCDSVVHLAAEPNDADFLKALLKPNVVGLYNVFNSAQRRRVRRLVFASTMQTIWGVENVAKPIGTDVTHPINHYALTKAWAEQMGEMYARKFDMSIIGSRIGWVVRDPEGAKKLADYQCQHIYLSPGDTARFFVAAVEAEHTGYTTLYATSAEGVPRYDLASAERTIGYVPQDRWPIGIDPAWLE